MRTTSDGWPLVSHDSSLGRLLGILSDKFTYPYFQGNEDSYASAVKRNVSLFIRTVEDVSESDAFTKRLKSNLPEYVTIGSNLVEIVSKYLKGDASEAYELLDKTITLPFVHEYWGKLRLQIDDIYHIYRAREASEPLETREEIFHIPFDERHKVEARRYSIAGVPCLYLGSSIFVCWLEMHRPDLNKLYISCFMPTSEPPLRVLDLTTSFALLLSQNKLGEHLEDKNRGEIIDYVQAVVATWVITQACSFKRMHQDARFNVEYILPNLLLQWVRNNKDVEGIRYSSTHYDFRQAPNLGYNYVFPPKNIDGRFCSYLCGAFKLTKPAPWQILQSLVSKRILGAHVGPHNSITFEDQLLGEYINTSFGTIEHLLSEDPNKMRSIGG